MNPRWPRPPDPTWMVMSALGFVATIVLFFVGIGVLGVVVYVNQQLVRLNLSTADFAPIRVAEPVPTPLTLVIAPSLTDTATSTPTSTDTPVPTDTPFPTGTAMPTSTEAQTLIPTDTPLPTDTAMPTSTEAQTLIPTDTPSPTLTAMLPATPIVSSTNNPQPFVCNDGCSEPPDPSCSIKGNINNEDVRIYHKPGMRDYERTDIDPSQGERWFCTDNEALAAGWRIAQQ